MSCVLCTIPKRDRGRPPEEKEVLYKNLLYYVVAPLGRSKETHQMVVPRWHVDVAKFALYFGVLYAAAVKIGRGFGSFEIYISEGEYSGVTVPGHAHLQVVRFDPNCNSTGMGTGLMKSVIDFLPTQQVDHAREVCTGRLRRA